MGNLGAQKEKRNDTPPAFAPAFKAFLISRFLSPIIVLPRHNLLNVLEMFFKMLI